MFVRFARSSRRHRVGKARALAAMEAAGDPIRVPSSDGDSGERLLWIGLDNRGVELEVIAVEQPWGVLVIHVMPAFYRRPRRKETTE